MLGDLSYQYFKSTNKYIEISGSNFFLSSSGEVFLSNVGVTHNTLEGLQGGTSN